MSNARVLRRSRIKKIRFLCLLVLPIILGSTLSNTSAAAHRTGGSAQPAQARVVESYSRLPLAFEANDGQVDPQVKFLTHGAGYSLFLTSNEAVLRLGTVSRQKAGAPTARSLLMKNQPTKQEARSVLRMKLLGASTKAEITGQDQLPGKSNYFAGNDPKNWHTNIPQFAKVHYASIYPGVDLVYYGGQRELEYDFVVLPAADPNVIRFGIEGAQDVRLEQGDLVLTSASGKVSLRRPHIYQQVNGTRHDIGGGYVLNSKKEVGFRISNYDSTRTLIIDPVLAYSTYLGATGYDNGTGIAVDSARNVYVTGYSDAGAFVTKVNADGTAIIYSTYLTGGSGTGIAVDSVGNAYVTGSTYASNFPTVNPIQPTNHGVGDAFVTKVNPSGAALVYSTYLGGSGNDSASGIAVDSAGNAHVTGLTLSNDFPTFNAMQLTHLGFWDAFVTKINPLGTAMVYSTYLGGSGDDSGSGIAVDKAGNTYVTGLTNSTDFPTVNPIQLTNHGLDDVFVTKINAIGTALVYSTYLGGSAGEWGSGIAVDSAGSAYVAGSTDSADFPTVNAIQTKLAGSWDAFVMKVNASGTALVYSTYLGGTNQDLGGGIAVDSAGSASLTGNTVSRDFPTVNAIQPTYRGNFDAYVTKINASGTGMVYSTYLGGSVTYLVGSGGDSGSDIAVDSGGSVYVTGYTQSTNFPHTALALQQSLNPPANAFVTKIASRSFVSVSPAKIAFGTFVIGKTSASKTLTVTNQGSGTLKINKIFMGGASISEFTQTNNCPSSLPAAGFCTVSLTFTPGAAGKRQAVLGISSSDPASPQAIPVNGTGTAVSLSPKSLSFGTVPVGKTTSPKTVTLTNAGSTLLNFSGFRITGTNATDFSQTNTCGTSIAAGAQCTITVTFKPTALGTRKATVSITDDGGGSPQGIGLSGTGI